MVASLAFGPLGILFGGIGGSIVSYLTASEYSSIPNLMSVMNDDEKLTFIVLFVNELMSCNLVGLMMKDALPDDELYEIAVLVLRKLKFGVSDK